LGKDETCEIKPYVKSPKSCTCETSEGPGHFRTQATYKNLEGRTLTWNSRYYRKHKSNLDINIGSVWWAPSAVSWWIGILFAIGATCFTLGSFPIYIKMVSTIVDYETYFIGSIFFTTAAYLQYLETINAPIHLCRYIIQELRFLTWEPHRIDWWSTLIQFSGTLFFNISTLAALPSFLLLSNINNLVWGPDVYGSICFLTASYLAWIEVGNGFWSLKPSNISWRIVALNLIGSIAFGVSAIASYVSPSTGLPLSLTLTNLGTFAGAVCFFLGAVLLLPERMMKNIN
jgi:hypothetical protein